MLLYIIQIIPIINLLQEVLIFYEFSGIIHVNNRRTGASVFILPRLLKAGAFYYPKGISYELQIHKPIFWYRRLGTGVTRPANGKCFIMRNR